MSSLEDYLQSLTKLIEHLPSFITFPNLIFFWVMVYFSFKQFGGKKPPNELGFLRVAFIGAVGGGIGMILYGGGFILMALLDPGSLIAGLVGGITLSVVLSLFGATIGVPLAFFHIGVLKVIKHFRSS